MALGFQQNRPVTPFTGTVTALTGELATLEVFTNNTNGVLVDGTYTLEPTSNSVFGSGAMLQVVIAVGVITGVTIDPTDTSSGYAIGDLFTIAETLAFSSLATGNITVAVATVNALASASQEISTVGVDTGGTGWEDNDEIQSDEVLTDSVSGSGYTGYVTTNGSGVVTTLTTMSGGTGYVVGDSIDYNGSGEVGVDDTRYVDHDQYELGGIQTEYVTDKSSYTPTVLAEDMVGHGTLVGDPSRPKEVGQRFDDNASTVKVVLKADLAQWNVQQRDIDGGAITVFAEPNIVDANGYRVGNNLRAEDMTDQARCEANGFIWVPNSPTGDAGLGLYGACRELVAADFDGISFTATAHADCPVGSKWDGATGCTLYTAAEVNVLTQSATQIKRDECIASGNHWEPNAATGTECISTLEGQHANFSLANFNYNTTSSAIDYAKTACIHYGFRWKADDYTCIADSAHGGLITKATCVDAGHVWIAGACYDGADFGDGQNRTATLQSFPNYVPK